MIDGDFRRNSHKVFFARLTSFQKFFEALMPSILIFFEEMGKESFFLNVINVFLLFFELKTKFSVQDTP